MHPIERLRWVARAPEGDLSLVAAEAAEALAAFAGDPAGLVIASRRLIERRPAAGPLWWLASRVLCSLDPGFEAVAAAAELAGGRRRPGPARPALRRPDPPGGRRPRLRGRPPDGRRRGGRRRRARPHGPPAPPGLPGGRRAAPLLRLTGTPLRSPVDVDPRGGTEDGRSGSGGEGSSV